MPLTINNPPLSRDNAGGASYPPQHEQLQTVIDIHMPLITFGNHRFTISSPFNSVDECVDNSLYRVDNSFEIP
jgi:hypothetical protein